MPSLTSLFIGILSVASAVAAFPFNATELFASDLETRQTITSSQTGYNNGYYYSFWNAGGGTVQYQNLAQGEYKVVWQNCNNFVAGKGWNPGGPRTVSFGGYYGPSGNSYLSLYGWTTSPLVEYYVVESFGTYDPSSGASFVGTVYSDGSSYNIYKTTRYKAPFIQGTSTFAQYWSVRQSKRTSGRITAVNHFNAWSSHGMSLGSHNYMIMATEGYQNSGTADIYVG